MTKEVPLRLLLAVVAAGIFLAISTGGSSDSASAAPQIVLANSDPTSTWKPVDCAPIGHDPGAYDIIQIENHGDAPLDLTGWVLKSDPEDTQLMSLDVAGTLAPLVDPKEDRVLIVAGQHSESYPDRNVYQWSRPEILRDSGDPPDYVRLYDPNGNLIDSKDCNQNPVPLATAVPATSTPAPQVASNQPAESTQPAGQTTANDQQSRAATSGQSPVGQAATAPSSGSVPAPNSGVGSLSPMNATSWPLAFAALAVGLAGLATSGVLLLRNGARRR
jgi:hypothetical protein